MTIAIYPGSFDPFTNGHLDIVKQGAEVFEKIIVAIAYNEKKQGFLSKDTRIKLISECVKEFKNVEVQAFDGLTVDFAKKCGASVLLRGLRNTVDFEYEVQMAQINMALYSDIKTVFLITKPENSCISSSGVREILHNNGDITNFVPLPVKKFLESNK